MVLRRGKKEAVLVDFGLACNIDKFTTRDGRTPGYAPPEQYTPGEQLGFYTDVYALATTLYYLLTLVWVYGLGSSLASRLVTFKI